MALRSLLCPPLRFFWVSKTNKKIRPKRRCGGETKERFTIIQQQPFSRRTEPTQFFSIHDDDFKNRKEKKNNNFCYYERFLSFFLSTLGKLKKENIFIERTKRNNSEYILALSFNRRFSCSHRDSIIMQSGKVQIVCCACVDRR